MAESVLNPAVIVLYFRRVDRRSPWGATLRNPRFETIAGRGCVVGEYLCNDPAHWAQGRKCVVPWDEVASAFEFESEEAYAGRLKGRRRGLRSLLR